MDGKVLRRLEEVCDGLKKNLTSTQILLSVDALEQRLRDQSHANGSNVKKESVIEKMERDSSLFSLLSPSLPLSLSSLSSPSTFPPSPSPLLSFPLTSSHSLAPPSSLPSPTVFLTGSTGFLGVHLLLSLLSQTNMRIYCLIRAKNSQSAMERLKKALSNAGAHSLSDALTLTHERVRIVCGDLTDPLFGMSFDDFRTLLFSVTHIVHCGALV